MTGWVRLWHEMPFDPKWRVIAKKSGQPISMVIAVFNFLLVNASANASERGRTHNFFSEDVAAGLDAEASQIDAIISAMQGKVLDDEKLLGWEKRQAKREDNSAERAKSWRDERKRTQANASELQDKIRLDKIIAVAPLPPSDTSLAADTNSANAAAGSEFTELIKAFDAVRVQIWGESQGRLAPAPNDGITAETWMKSGITASYCRDYFTHEMAKMKSKVRQPPRSLAFFDEGIRQSFSSGKRPISAPVSENSTWKMRISGWKEKGFWLPIWGDPPTSKTCQAPQQILEEFGLAA